MKLPQQRGATLLLVLLAAVLALLSAGALALGAAASAASRDRATERALVQAREALIAYAADRPIDGRVGPGYLPCPDLDDDGWAESTCGSLTGAIGQADRLGRLPWKTLGLPDLRDGDGERLWYAVSTRHKGLLNCAGSRACLDMTPASALGTITVRSPSGAVEQDGTLADPALAASGGAAAVVIAPGGPIVRADGHVQERGCRPGECDVRGRCLADPPTLVARCDPRNYLDAAAFEDNAAFSDRTDTRASNRDGFVQGPVRVDGDLVVNDRLAIVAYPDLMARVMARVAIEVAQCVRTVPQEPESACPSSAHLGRVADAALAAPGCNAAPDPPGWWAAWKPFVLYARAVPGGLEVVDESGARIAAGQRFAIRVTQRANECAAGIECGPDGCTRALRTARSRDRHDALVAMP